MKSKVILIALAVATLSSGVAFAQAKAPEPAYTLAYNAGLVSDYRFRGISQTRLKPALQGGADFTHNSGLYLGVWASSIKVLKDIPGGKGSVELDLYGGFRGAVTEALAFDVGVLRYQYPSQNFTPTVNTTELYGALTYGPVTVKYSSSVGKQTFGVGNSRGTGYLEAAATFDLGNGFSVVPHIGRQDFHGSGNNAASYTDYSVALNKDFGNGLVGSFTIVDTNAGSFYTSPANGKDLGKAGVVLGVKYNF